MIHLTLASLDLLNPAWSKTPLEVGVEVTLSVEAPGITNQQTIRFDILRGFEVIDVVTSKPGKVSATWTPPNLPGASSLEFRAHLLDKPVPTNGHAAVVATVKSPTAQLNGFAVDPAVTIDAAFVPKQEHLNVTFTVTDPDGAAKKGRYEIWGERYPGAQPAPLYTEDFKPAAGARTWSSWDGKANAGLLKGKYISPEFSPYRVRIVIASDHASVKDPYGVGQGKVAVGEAQFEITVHSIHIRVQAGIKEAAAQDEHKLKDVVVIEPRAAAGTFAATSRLPLATETARLRIPMVRFLQRGEALDQGGPNVVSAYLAGGGVTKYSLDSVRYSRPEIPIEFEARLKSRDNAVNNDVNRRGLFEKAAVGPLRIDPIAEDHYVDARYPNGGALADNQRYLKNAAFKVKAGTHSAPVHTAANGPRYDNWQARIEVAADGTQDFDISTFNATSDCVYAAGSNQLTVYLNREKLELSARADDNELNDGTKDYREVAAVNAAQSVRIRLAPNRTRAGDVVWVVRTSGGAIAAWPKFPPGPNCHLHYGGVRGSDPAADLGNYFRRAFSPNPAAPRDPIVGKCNGTYPYTDTIDLRPDLQLNQDQQERIEISARTSGAQQGLAGVIFSPSTVCGDTYVIRASLEHEPYERSFGFIQPRARDIDSKTGPIVVWRRLQINRSLRRPGIPDAGVPYHGDGVNMSISAMNAQYADAFNEWTLPSTPPVHRDINLTAYRNAHNTASAGLAGRVPLTNNGAVTDEFVRYDFYRETLPPGVTLPNLATNRVDAYPAGTDSMIVGNDYAARVAAAGGVDPALAGGLVAALPVYGGNEMQYFWAAFGRRVGIARQVVDALCPRDPQPRRMNVVRWPKLHESPFWGKMSGGGLVASASPLIWNGQGLGDGNSLFCTGVPNATLFAHEMGHSTHLLHFVAGNFCWKHHDLNVPGCLMSYDFPTGNIWPPVGAVGPNAGPGAPPGGVAAPVSPPPPPPPPPWPLALGATDVEHGWPHWASNPPPAGPLHWCIKYGPNIALGGFCARCLLKLAGWDEDQLPVAWRHPDLF